jgi:hypothetical protein
MIVLVQGAIIASMRHGAHHNAHTALAGHCIKRGKSRIEQGYDLVDIGQPGFDPLSRDRFEQA